MSRIGKQPVTIPAGVTVTVDKEGVTVKGPKGSLYQQIDPDMKVVVEGSEVKVSRPTDQKRHRAMHGLYRALIQNMIVGVTTGYTKEMELEGVGYKAEAKGQNLELVLGLSHTVLFVLPPEVKVETETKKGERPQIRLFSIDKQLLGQVSAKIQSVRPPEPYKGKGIRFKGQFIRRKVGKASGKGGKK
jgi:large subunit ribosomal protein L6